MGEEVSSTVVKGAVLLMLCFFTAGEGLLVQYSREIKHEKYSSVEVITVSETLKMSLSIVLMMCDSTGSNDASSAPKQLPPWYSQLYSLIVSGRKMFLLVILYTMSNFCSLYATGTVGASVSTVVSQLKVLTTAMCGMCVLGKSYSIRKWLCLFLLVVGCICVSYPTIREAYEHQNVLDKTHHVTSQQKALGLFCLVLQISISGFASVYFELVLKDKQEKVSIWERNFQLAFFSVMFTILVVFCQNSYESYKVTQGSLSNSIPAESVISNLFAGWTLLAVLISVMLGGAGLSVAGTLKYADAVLKCFATSMAIIVVSIANVLCFGHPFNGIQGLGIVLAVTAITGYTFDAIDVDTHKFHK